jgi:hypothetical protein
MLFCLALWDIPNTIMTQLLQWPEQGLLMRKSWDCLLMYVPLYIPVFDHSPLKRERIEGTDLIFYEN